MGGVATEEVTPILKTVFPKCQTTNFYLSNKTNVLSV